ncbi:MAG: hypothetical protein R3B90_13455 [Planctomycetaceae bacterium]
MSWKLFTHALMAGSTALVLAGLTGCESQEGTRSFNAAEGDNVENTDPHDHAAHAHGPHDGHIVELGGEDYHAEVTMDEAKKTLTVYLLAADMTTPLGTEADSASVRLQIGDAKQEFVLQPTDRAEDGKATVFSQTDSTLPDSIQDAEDLIGEVVVTINGKQHRGEITHDHGHDDHGHDDHGHDH